MLDKVIKVSRRYLRSFFNYRQNYHGKNLPPAGRELAEKNYSMTGSLELILVCDLDIILVRGRRLLVSTS